MRDLFGAFGFVVAILLLVSLIIGPIAILANHLNHRQCANNVMEMGREYRYDWLNGCRIGLDDGTFIYWKMYRDTDG